MTTFRNPALVTGFSAIDKLRADRWLGGLARGVGIALTLHRVRPKRADDFQPNLSLEITPPFLSTLVSEIRAAGFEFVTIDDVLGRLRAARRGTRPFAVLTFDDGYRDNVTFAAPILKKEGVPWTVFAVPDFLDGKGRLWWIEIEEAVARLGELRLDGKVIDCRTAGTKRRVFEQLRRLCHALDEDGRAALCDRLAGEAGLKVLHHVRDHCLDWDEMAAACHANDLTVGSHTESHTILSGCSNDASQRQIASSKLRLETHLGLPVNHLAYPHGATSGNGVRESDQARDAGYVAAWTTRPAHLARRSYQRAPYALPRVTVNGLYPNRAMLRTVLSGIPFVGRRG